MKAGDREKLWDKYKVNATPELREQLILEYAPLVKIVAGRHSQMALADICAIIQKNFQKNGSRS